MSEPQIIFKEATTVYELHELFCLRKRVLLNSRLSVLAKPNDAELDIERWDRYAHHMGLYLVIDGRAEAIGYQRGVVEELCTAHTEVERLATAYPSQEAELFQSRKTPFPCLEYLSNSEAIRNMCSKYRSAGVKIGESTRFTLDERFRSIRLTLVFVKCVIARYMFNDHLGLALTAVNSSCKRAYIGLGFSQPLGFEDRFTSLFGRQFSPLCMDPSNVSPAMAKEYTSMANELRVDGFTQADSTLTHKALRTSSLVKQVA